MIEKEKCTACGACVASCPKKCIQFKSDSSGQSFPIIDKKNCMNCNICYVVCPQNNPPKFRNSLKCYAAWSTDKADLLYCASGGVATVFSRYQLETGNPVFGCDYDSSGNLSHFQLRSFTDLSRTQSSKYSHSDAYSAFDSIRFLLGQGKKVLFIGTPCQTAGLLTFLKRPYKNLITVDLVCHGAPPNEYFKRYLKEAKIPLPIDRIRFRGEYDQQLTVWHNSEIVHQKPWKQDMYFHAFYRNMISYDSCYSCSYAQAKRVSDITIGDFWGLGKLKHIEPQSKRPSLILINTPSGQVFFDEVKNRLLYEERNVEEGITGNGRLNSPPGKNGEAAKFQRFYKLRFLGFIRSVRLAIFTQDITHKFREKRKRKKGTQ